MLSEYEAKQLSPSNDSFSRRPSRLSTADAEVEDRDGGRMTPIEGKVSEMKLV
jgi:hypothetical protein